MVSIKRREAGFSLLELSLAIAIGLTIMASSVWMLKQHNAEARVQQSKMLLATIRTNLAAYRYRFGTYPTITEFQRNWATPGSTEFQIVPGASRSPADILANSGAVNEPVSGVMKVYDRRLAPPDGTRVGGPEATATYGGWFYDADNGTVSVNLDADKFKGDNPTLW